MWVCATLGWSISRDTDTGTTGTTGTGTTGARVDSTLTT